MSKIFGQQSEPQQLQPGWTIRESFDETLTGTCEFICDSIADAQFSVGDKHPKDDRLELINFEISGRAQGKVSVLCEYFGLSSIPSKAIWSYFNATNEEPIEAHPNFSNFAGDAETPLNGALFNEDTEAFLGFSTGTFAGVRGFLDGKPVLRKTWYSDKATEGISDVMKIKKLKDGAIPGVPPGSDTLKTNWGNTPIGNFYNIWEEYSISGRNGWNTDIYESS